MNQTEQYLTAVDQIWNTPVPDEVMARAKRSLLDYLAVTCAGSAFQKDKLQRYTDFAMPEEGAFKVIGTGRSLALKEAVFLNGLNAHALDFDDGTNSGIIHLGSPIFSLLLPLAQRYGFTVSEVLRAAVTGYEASYTMAITIQPGHKKRGYHATGTCGTLGATLAGAYMLGFTDEERLEAFSAACVASTGMLKVLDNGSEFKPYNVAKASLMALTALQMAKAGFKGDGDPLGGRGFYHMMTGADHADLQPTRAGGTYAIMKSYTKPYASCRYTHPAVEAAIWLRTQIPADEVRGIRVRTYDLAVAGHDHTEIPGSYSAKMSIPYSVAAAYLNGKAGLQEFTEEAVKGDEVLDLTGRVSVCADDEMSRQFPEKQSALVTVISDKGELSRQVDFPKGEPENPMTEEEFRDRYDGLMGYGGVDEAVSGRIYRLVQDGACAAKDLVEIL